jgi:hypothetical protein
LGWQLKLLQKTWTEEQLELIGALYFPFLNSNPDHWGLLAGNFDLDVL